MSVDMTIIQQLNKIRAETALHLENLGVMNVPTDYALRLKQDAQYRLASDAHQRAEREYRDALAALSVDDLIEIAK